MKDRVNYIVPFRGRFELLERCIQSLFSQANGDWLAHIVEDNSNWDVTDRKKLHVLIDSDPRITLYENSERQGPLHNVYDIIVNHLKGEDTIIAQLDGDDWLLPNATNVILELHEAADVTYGQFLRYAPWTAWHMQLGHCRDYPKQIQLDNAYEDYPWLSSHLKTFKRKYFINIPYESFIDVRSGNFWDSAYDQAFMLPILIMADNDKIHFNRIPIYVYDMEDRRERHVHENKQIETERYIRQAVKYYIKEGNRFEKIE
jgi:glycosyltransferase involved in cell wall biosynthesis